MAIRLALGGLLALLVFLTAYPLAMLVYGSLHTTPPGAAGTFNLDGYRTMLSRSNAIVLLNTLGLSLVKTLLARWPGRPSPSAGSSSSSASCASCPRRSCSTASATRCCRWW
jgi:ABC-type spermidine/putrescine transport system permease subunit I